MIKIRPLKMKFVGPLTSIIAGFHCNIFDLKQ